MHEQFIAIVRLHDAFYNSKSVDDFKSVKLPALCSYKRLRDYDAELRKYADIMVPLYSHNARIGYEQSYKSLIMEAMELVKTLERCTSDNEMENLIIYGKSIGIMILSACLIEMTEQFKVHLFIDAFVFSFIISIFNSYFLLSFISL